MDQDIIRVLQDFQSFIDRIVPFRSAFDDLCHFFEAEIRHHMFSGTGLALSHHQDDLIHRAFFKSVQRVPDQRFSVQQHILFSHIAFHPPAFSGGKEDRCDLTHFFHLRFLRFYRCPIFRLGTAFRSRPCRVPARYS